MPEKKCTKCGEVKPLEMFYFRKDSGKHREDCGSCVAARAAAWKASNRERASANNRASYHRDIERTKRVAKDWRDQNKDKIREYNKRSIAKPEVKQRKCEYDAQWKLKNPELVAAYKLAWLSSRGLTHYDLTKQYRKRRPEIHRADSARRRAARLRAVMHSELLDFVEQEAFTLAELRRIHTNIAWHVDHVIPLNGDSVSGLHVASNLAVVPAKYNILKSNKFDPDLISHWAWV